MLPYRGIYTLTGWMSSESKMTVFFVGMLVGVALTCLAYFVLIM